VSKDINYIKIVLKLSLQKKPAIRRKGKCSDEQDNDDDKTLTID